MPTAVLVGMNKFNKSVLAYAILPVLGAFALVGVNNASADNGLSGIGWFKLGFNLFSLFTPQQIAAQQQAMFQFQATVASASLDEVKNAWVEGKSIEKLAREKGVTNAKIKVRMMEAQLAKFKLFLQTLVSQNVITQVQADKRLALFQKENKIGASAQVKAEVKAEAKKERKEDKRENRRESNNDKHINIGFKNLFRWYLN